MISDPEVELIDVRNDYEVEIGSFEGAENPQTETFGEWDKYVKKRWAKRAKEKGGYVLHRWNSFTKKPPHILSKMDSRRFII